jgi:imidazolonepropionase-like amidohydrolase
MICLLAILFAGCTPAKAGTVLLRSGQVVDIDCGCLTEPVDLMIEGGHIRSIEPAGKQPLSADRVIDARGRYILPGFIEMHAHILLHPWMPDGEIARQYDRQWSLQMLRMLLAHGITTVRDPGSPTESAIFLRERIASGELEGPTLFTAGRILTAAPFPYEPFVHVPDAEAIRQEIAWQASAGVNFIKLYGSFTPELTQVAIQAAQQHNLPVVGHLGRTDWTTAARLGLAGFEHPSDWNPAHLSSGNNAARRPGLASRIDWLEAVEPDGPLIANMASAIVEADAFVTPTLVTVHSKFFGNQARYLNPPERGLVPENIWIGWEAGSFTRTWRPADYLAAQAVYHRLERIIRVLNDRGVVLTIGTDTPTPWTIPGVSFHQEMALMREIGVSNIDVLRMATINGARALRIEERVGRVAPGYEADLLILSANPLLDLANTRAIDQVIVDGRLVTLADRLQSTR